MPIIGQTSRKGRVVLPQDIFIAKNYLSFEAADKQNRPMTIFLESAELRVRESRDFTMNFWCGNMDALLSFHDLPLLLDSGSVRNVQKEAFAESVYEKFSARRRRTLPTRKMPPSRTLAEAFPRIDARQRRSAQISRSRDQNGSR